MTVTPLCPSCGARTLVSASRRAQTTPNAMRRRRVCEGCGHTFSTIEAVETAVIAEAFIIELVVEGTPTTVMVDDISKIGGEIARIAGPRTYPATIHHWRLHRAINGRDVEWKKEKVFPWP